MNRIVIVRSAGLHHKAAAIFRSSPLQLRQGPILAETAAASEFLGRRLLFRAAELAQLLDVGACSFESFSRHHDL